MHAQGPYMFCLPLLTHCRLRSCNRDCGFNLYDVSQDPAGDNLCDDLIVNGFACAVSAAVDFARLQLR